MNTTAAQSCFYLAIAGLLTLLLGILSSSTGPTVFGILALAGAIYCKPVEQRRNNTTN